jgi:hypothetical protein
LEARGAPQGALGRDQRSPLTRRKVTGERSPTGLENRERFGVQVRLLCLPLWNVTWLGATPAC